MAEKDRTTQVAVIGGGPGGYAAAFAAADLGLQVTLIDAEPKLGGVCLHRGCIPSKALLHVASLLRQAKQAEQWGIHFGEPQIDREALIAWKRQVTGKMADGLTGLSKQRKIETIHGRARFLDPHTLHVDHADGGQGQVKFEHAILATGSRPIVVPTLNIDSPRVMDSTAALELEEIPGSLLVVGGGYIGLELATVYSALGTQVTVVEMTDKLLLGFDRDLVRVLNNRLKQDLAEILLSTKVVSMKEAGDRIQVAFEGADGAFEKEYDRVLVAVGRRPNTEGLGLENTKVQLDERGFVKVDLQRRTDEPSIFAIGDVAGEPMLAHKAAHEGRVAAHVISGRKVAFEPQVIPAVAFTDPEIASCGLSEDEAKAQGRNVKVVRFPWGASGRATTLDRPDGLTKLIIDPETEHVLGVGIVGVGAGEMISEGVLAIEMGALAEDVMLSIHPHPTLSETVMEAAEAVYGSSTHVYRRSS